MELVKYDEKAHENNKNLPLLAFGRGTAYLRDFCERYDNPERIIALMDDNVREQGKVIAGGKEIPIRDFSFLREFENELPERFAVLLMEDYYRELYDAVCQIPQIEGRVTKIYYYANRETEIEERYRFQYADKPLENIVVFRSGPHPDQYVPGMDFADNARALFEYMLSKGYNENYELVWLVKNPEDYKRYSEYKNVNFYSYEWSVSGTEEQKDAYYRAMCLAKYIFFTDAYGFARNCRSDQIRFQLWHGCGFKNRVNFTRCEKRYEYKAVTSLLYKEVHSRVYGLKPEQMAVVGCPKEDWIFHPVEQPLSELFNLPRSSKYIFWLPTFRNTESHLGNLNEFIIEGETGLPVVDSADKMARLNEALVENDVTVLIKLHPFQKRDNIRCEKLSNICLIENDDLLKLDIPINRLLGKADALISDYSSAAVDYLVLDRPIGFLLDDVGAFEASRGFLLNPIRDYLPGAELFSMDDMITFVCEVAKGIDSSKEKRRQLRYKMHAFADDKNCERVVKFLGMEKMR